MSLYHIQVMQPIEPIDSTLFHRIKTQFEKDLFFAIRAFDIQVHQMSFKKDQWAIKLEGSFQRINEFMTFLILRMTTKAQKLIFRSYQLLKV